MTRQNQQAQFRQISAEQRPSWVPKEVVSQQGILSAQNFLHLLFSGQLKGKTEEESLLWFFQQRKFPQFSPGGVDTMVIPKDIKNAHIAPVDSEGFAASASKHEPHKRPFLSEDSVMQIYPCTSVKIAEYATENPLHGVVPGQEAKKPKKVPIGKYADGKVMIQQQAIRGCVAACAAMLVEDSKHACDLKSLFMTNLADEEDIIRWLKEAGLNGKGLTVEGNDDEVVKQLHAVISTNGSITVALMKRA